MEQMVNGHGLERQDTIINYTGITIYQPKFFMMKCIFGDITQIYIGVAALRLYLQMGEVCSILMEDLLISLLDLNDVS